jgi:hypothetical protein
MAIVRHPDGSITVGIIPEPKEAKEPAPKRGGKTVKK